jgi:hypothetical protein
VIWSIKSRFDPAIFLRKIGIEIGFDREGRARKMRGRDRPRRLHPYRNPMRFRESSGRTVAGPADNRWHWLNRRRQPVENKR